MNDETSDTRVLQIWMRLKGNGIGAILIRGASGSFLVLVISAIVVFGLNAMLARILGVTQYGIYVYSLTWINLLSMASQLGFVNALVRFVSEYNSHRQWGLFRGVLAKSIQYVTLASCLIAGVAALVVWLLGDRIAPEQAKTLWLGLLLLPVLSVTGLRQGTMRGLKRVVWSGIPDGILRPLLLAVLVAAFYFCWEGSLEAPQTMMFNLAAASAAFLAGTLVLIKSLPTEVRRATPVFARSHWIKVSLPMFLSSGMFLVLRQADILMVGIIMGPEHAGIYAVVSRITDLVSFGKNAIDSIAAPMISELYSTKQYRALQGMVRLAARVVFTFTFAASFSLAVLGVNVLSVFGDAFIVGYGPLVILLSGEIIASAFGSAGFLMSMTGHHNQAALLVGISAGVNILLNAVLIPHFGLQGAALATALSNALWSFLVLNYVRDRLSINPTIFAKRCAVLQTCRGPK